MSRFLIEPTRWRLKRASLSAYYTLHIERFQSRYYLVQRHGKMGAIWPRSVLFDGIEVGDKNGYATRQEAFVAGEKLIEKKLRQKDDEAYEPLQGNESFVFEIKDQQTGRTAIELFAVEQLQHA